MSNAYEYREIERFEEMANVNVPVDKHGHYLDHNDVITQDNKAMARELTSPYGSLEYAVGYEPDENNNESELDDSNYDSNDDWFRCFDHAELPDGRLILHSVVNSESSNYNENAGYFIVHKDDAPSQAMIMVEDALVLIEGSKRTHDEEGWNQDPYYFVRSVAAKCGLEPYASSSDANLRRGTVPSYQTLVPA